MNKRSFAILAVVLVAVLFGCSSSNKNAGNTAPDFRADDLTGRTVYLNAELRNGPVVLTFFATWCEPCREEAPLLAKLADKYKGRAQVLCLAVDPENKDKIATFAKSLSLPYPVLMDEGRKIMERYGVSQLPATFLLGKDGRIYSRFDRFGETEQKALQDALDRLLEK